MRKQINKIVDFTNHNHTVEIYKCGDNEIRIDHLKLKDTYNKYVQFVNSQRGLAVFGDYGNWIFCRRFIPAADEKFSLGYWEEKATIDSIQNFKKIDLRAMEDYMQEIHNEAEHFVNTDNVKALREGIENLNYENEYVFIAGLYDLPISLEYIDFIYETPIRLKIIGEAFDEICKRLKNCKPNTVN